MVHKALSFLLSLLILYGIYRLNSWQMHYSSRNQLISDSREIKVTKLLVLPGSGKAYNFRPNYQFNGRVQKAAEILLKDTSLKVLISGYHDGKEYAETTEMGAALIRSGVNSNRILYDSLAQDTFQTILNLKDRDMGQTYIFVSQDRHLARTLWIARQMGLKVSGIIAPGWPGSTPEWRKSRERLACIKARLNVWYYEITSQRNPWLH